MSDCIHTLAGVQATGREDSDSELASELLRRRSRISRVPEILVDCPSEERKMGN